MAWENEMIEILRALIDDMDETPRNSDTKLERLLVVSAFQVANELDFTNTYTVNVSQQSISPDPTAEATREDSFVNLVCLKAACIIDRGSAALAASRAGFFRDGGSTADLRGIATAKLQLLKQGWCAVYEEEKDSHLKDASSIAGAAIMTPFRLYAHGRHEGGDGWGRRITPY